MLPADLSVDCVLVKFDYNDILVLFATERVLTSASSTAGFGKCALLVRLVYAQN